MNRIAMYLVVFALIMGYGVISSGVAFAQMYDYGYRQPTKSEPPNSQTCGQAPPQSAAPYPYGPYRGMMPPRYYGPRNGQTSPNVPGTCDPVLAILGGL